MLRGLILPCGNGIKELRHMSVTETGELYGRKRLRDSPLKTSTKFSDSEFTHVPSKPITNKKRTSRNDKKRDAPGRTSQS